MVGRITPAELKALQDADEGYTLVDTRSEEDYEAFHLRGARNVRYHPDEEPSDEEIERQFEDVDTDERIVLICAKGISAAGLVERLEELDYENVQMVDDGMVGWSTVYDTVTMPVGDGLEVIQFQRRAKGCLSYVVGSKSDGKAVVVDPTRHTDAFVDAATDAGYEVEAILDTHVHADHVSGAPNLATVLDVPYYLGAPASDRGIEHEHERMEPNDVLEVGSVGIKTIHVPGHTGGMVNLLLDGSAMLTADTLHVDSVGRVELAFEDGDASEGAHELYDSLHETILALPDGLSIYPGHVTVSPGGAFENGTPGAPIESTVGALRRNLDVLQLAEDAFVTRLTGDVPEKPPNYETIVAANRGLEEPGSKEEAEQIELGPNNCAA